ncbi:MAG TPA: hypothetical protein VFR97_03460 [Capillimicrobium sp.]|nr:hypothetical protein [Capillimicrobium sp.]
MTRRADRAGTFYELTPRSVAGAAWAGAAALAGVACWRAGLPAAGAVVVAALAGAAGAVAWERRRRGRRPAMALALFVGWAALVGPVAALLARAIWPG